MSRRAPLTAAAILAPLALAACATPIPTGPSVLALPSQGKSLAEFQQEDGSCRYYASQQIGNINPSQAANQSAVGSAAIGTALGAAAGAVIGAAAGNAGAGAAIGGGSGLLLGTGAGAGNAAATGATLQQRYDIGYAQCMYARGNSVQGPLTAGGAYTAYAGYPYYGPVWGGTTVAFGFGGGGWHHGWGGWHRGW
jgi:Glycine-zipper domain